MTSPRASRVPSDALYVWLSRWGWPRSYAGKLLLIAFAGACVPLVAVLAYVAWSVSPGATLATRFEPRVPARGRDKKRKGKAPRRLA